MKLFASPPSSRTHRHAWRTRAAWLVLLLIVLAGAGALVQYVLTRQSHAAYPAAGQMVQVGSHRLHLHCMGQGQPVVVLESGLAGWSQDWVRVQPALAQHTTVCAYDRAGYAWSDEATPARTGLDAVEDLRSLLAAAQLRGPLVLVGHSLGGLLVQIYAQAHPQEVAGLVLVDSLHHDMAQRMAPDAYASYQRTMDAVTRSGTWMAAVGATRLAQLPSSVILNKLPEAEQASARAMAYQSQNYRTVRAEFLAVDAALEVARDLPPLPAVPIAVLSTQARSEFPPGWDSDYMRQQWIADQQALAHDIGVQLQTFAQSGHYLQLDHADAVTQAVLGVVQQVRGKAKE